MWLAFPTAWADDTDGNGLYQIHARGFNADGTPRFNRLTINSVATGQQLVPSLAMAHNGSFAVAWNDDADSDGNAQVYVRGFDASGNEQFADSLLSSASGNHLGPILSANPTGSLAAVWADDSDGNGTYQIHALTLASDGSPILSEWTVNREASGQQLYPGVAMGETETLVVVWEDDMDGNGVYQILARGY